MTSKLAPPTIGRLMGTIRAQGHHQASPPPLLLLHLLCQPLPQPSGLALVLLAPSEMSCPSPEPDSTARFRSRRDLSRSLRDQWQIKSGKCQGGTRYTAEDVLPVNISESSSVRSSSRRQWDANISPVVRPHNLHRAGHSQGHRRCVEPDAIIM